MNKYDLTREQLAESNKNVRGELKTEKKNIRETKRNTIFIE